MTQEQWHRQELLAQNLAFLAFVGIFRNDKVTPYYSGHLLPVAESFPKDDHVHRAIAFLHDILEDTSATADGLRREGVHERIVTAVIALTKIEGEGYEAYIQRVMANPDAVEVKKQDINHNLNDKPSKKAAARYRRALGLLDGTISPLATTKEPIDEAAANA